MNKTAIKNYAIWARVQLIEAAKQRAYEYEITENGENKSGLDMVGGRLLTKTEKEQRNQLISEINLKGFSQVMEEAAYTWFNRFIALRFMEVNGYLPSKVRVFTDDNGAFKPDILKQAISLDIEGVDRSKVLDLLDKQDNEELFKYLLITQCNALNAGLPYMFEKIGGWTELLFPAGLLRADSVIGKMISDIQEDDWKDAVQIIGWLYQYYNSEQKDFIANRPNTIKVTKNEIPAVTQLFTPDWIVRYMVENSLGRFWCEGHPDFNKTSWKYYINEAEQESEVEAKLQMIRAKYATIKPEEIKVIDPCMGSGHILVYAFDVLMQIYTSAGWSERDAAKSIIENNLYGLDIDDRAGQLAYFAVMMKARKHSRRILNGEVIPNILSIQDSNWMTDDFISFVAGKDTTMKADLVMLRNTFREAKEYGSILTVPTMKYDTLYERIDILRRSYAEDLFQRQYQVMASDYLLPLVRQSEIMSQKYDVVVTNPPYMGRRSMQSKFSNYLDTYFPNSKMDLFSVFIERNLSMTKKDGFSAYMTPFVWLFLSSYSSLRKTLVDSISIQNYVQPEESSFQEAAVSICSFVIRNTPSAKYKGTYVKMSRFKDPAEQADRLIEAARTDVDYKYNVAVEKYSEYPDYRFIYWASEALENAFIYGTPLEKVCQPRQGMATTNNELFLRLWFEVQFSKIGFGCKDEDDAYESGHKWFPYNKGGGLKRWYGNYDYVVNYENKGKTICDYIDNTPGARVGSNGRVINRQFFFHKSITWSDICGTSFAARACPQGFIFDVKGSSAFVSDRLYPIIVAFLNSSVCTELLNTLNPTVTTQVGDLKQLPLLFSESDYSEVSIAVEEAIQAAKEDYDSYETSWDFISHPLVGGYRLISEACKNQELNNERRIQNIKHAEETVNRAFINAYGLQNEMSYSVPDESITIETTKRRDSIVSLISYAVGCMFGRYSVDVEGLCYAGGEWDTSKYKTIIPDSDNIIPICDDDYFDDDIVGKFVDFVRKVYGEQTLEQNLRFVADVLGGKGTPREVIRSYFLNDFFADHCSTYSVSGSGKRPIYWLFSSGKKNGFKALIYMHRYQPDLLARMRTDYVHEQQERYRTQLQMLESSAQSAAPSEKVKLNKQIAKLKDQALEIQRYEEKIHHLADQMISIDLDDGVKVNYAKFQDVLEKIK